MKVPVVNAEGSKISVHGNLTHCNFNHNKVLNFWSIQSHNTILEPITMKSVLKALPNATHTHMFKVTASTKVQNSSTKYRKIMNKSIHLAQISQSLGKNNLLLQ